MKWSLSGSEGRREKPSGENSIYKGPESEKLGLLKQVKWGQDGGEVGKGERTGY